MTSGTIEWVAASVRFRGRVGNVLLGFDTTEPQDSINAEPRHQEPAGRIGPQGARLIGQYDSQAAVGQSRVLLVWTRLLMPNGNPIVLERQPDVDASGYSGLEDEVDNDWGALLKAALLSTLRSVRSEVAPAAARTILSRRSGAAARRVLIRSGSGS